MSEKNVTYQVHGLEVLDFSMFRKPQDFIGERFQFDISSETKVNDEIQTIILFFTITIREFEKSEKLAHMVIATAYKIINFEDVVIKNNEGLFVLPKNFEQHVAPISISTIRGIMFMQFRGTYLHRAILPIVLMNPPAEDEIKSH